MQQLPPAEEDAKRRQQSLSWQAPQAAVQPSPRGLQPLMQSPRQHGPSQAWALQQVQQQVMLQRTTSPGPQRGVVVAHSGTSTEQQQPLTARSQLQQSSSQLHQVITHPVPPVEQQQPLTARSQLQHSSSQLPQVPQLQVANYPGGSGSYPAGYSQPVQRPQPQQQAPQALFAEPVTARTKVQTPRGVVVSADGEAARASLSEPHFTVMNRCPSRGRAFKMELPASASQVQLIAQRSSREEFPRQTLPQQMSQQLQMQPVQQPSHSPPPQTPRLGRLEVTGEAPQPSPRPHREQEHLEQLERLQQQMKELNEQQRQHCSQEKQPQLLAATARDDMQSSQESQRATPRITPPCTDPVTKTSENDRWTPLQQTLQNLPTASRNKAQREVPVDAVSTVSSTTSSSNLRDTMGVFGLPEPPTPPPMQASASSRRGAGRPQEVSAVEGASFMTVPQLGSPSPASKKTPGGHPCSTPDDAATSFILAQPPLFSPDDKSSPSSKLNCGGDAWDSFVSRRGSASALKSNHDMSPPSPPRRLNSEGCGATCLPLSERLDFADFAAVASAVPSSIPGGQGGSESGASSSTDGVDKPSWTTTPQKEYSEREGAQPELPIQARSRYPLHLHEKASEARRQGRLSRNASTGSEKKLHIASPEGNLVPFSSPPAVTPIDEASHSNNFANLHCTEMGVQEAAAQVTLKELAELRSFRNPPAVVCQVLEAVAVVLGVPDCRWAAVRKLLDTNFLTRLQTFDPSGLSVSQQDRLRTLLQVPTFSDGSLSERCPAVASLAQWCNIVGRYVEGLAPASVCVPSARGAEVPFLDGLLVEPNLWQLSQEELVHVRDLTVTREGVGCVTFHGLTDCREIASCLPDVVVLNPGEVVIYPNQKVKPPVGSGLNKPASIKLYGCLPKTQSFRDEKAREKYRNRVRLMTEEKVAEFVDYDCDHGIWQFRVLHF